MHRFSHGVLVCFLPSLVIFIVNHLKVFVRVDQKTLLNFYTPFDFFLDFLVTPFETIFDVSRGTQLNKVHSWPIIFMHHSLI